MTNALNDPHGEYESLEDQIASVRLIWDAIGARLENGVCQDADDRAWCEEMRREGAKTLRRLEAELAVAKAESET